MAVSSVGTPTLTRAAAATVTGTWGTGQTRTTGNMLIAAVTATSDTSIGMITCSLAGKWNLRSWTGNTTDTAGYPGHATVAIFWCAAWGADAAPILNVTPAAGTVTMSVTLFELAGANLLGDPFDAIGWYQSGFASSTITSESATTLGKVTVTGEYAIGCYVQQAAAATNTWNAGAGWTNVATDGATSSTGHAAVDILANPTAAAVLSETTPHWTTGTAAFGAGILVVISPPVVPSQGYTLYQQSPVAVVTAGGTTAPASGTQETWTVTPSLAFPAVSTVKVPMASFHGNDPNVPSELVQVISCPGGVGAGQSWTVVRGAENSTPVAHTAGFTVNLVASAGDLGGTMPVYNVRAWPFNAPAAGGTADTGDGTAIQAALTACDANGGGIVYVPQGVYVCAQTLQIGSNTTLLGAGMGVSTIRQASTFNPTHVGGNQGLDLLITINNSGGVNIALSNLTFDGNQAGTPSMPGGFSAVQSYHLYLNSVTNLSIEAVEVINSIGYAMMVQNCEYFRVSRCHIVQGQAALGYNQQDGIHMTGSRFGTVTDNNIDTGVVTLVGDDCICVQSVSPDKPCTDITIKGNVLRSGTRAVSVVLAGGACSDIDITGNTVYGTINDGFVINYGVAGSPVATSINFTGNVLANISSGGSNCGINLQSVNSGLGAGTGNGWQDVTITGNGFYNIQASGSFAVAATGGTGLTIEGNTMDLMNVFTAILVGNNNAGASSPVTNFSVTGNIINMSTSAGSSPNGILLQDSHDGTVSGNTLIGGNQATSQAINLQGVGASVSGVSVTGNRCTGWTTAVAEVNSGAAPDFNVIQDNNAHGCTNAVTVLGGHTLAQPNVMDVGGIAVTEQFMALTAAYTLGTGTALQKLLNATTNGALTVPALTSYFFEAEFDLTGMSSTTGTFAFGFGGTATLTSVKYISYAQKSAAIATPATAQVAVANVATAVPLVGTSITTTGSAYVKGVVRINAAGTLIPSVALSVGIAAVVGVNSWFRLTPVGPNTITNAGNWS